MGARPADSPAPTGDERARPFAAPRGRRPSTSRQDVARAALELFARQGYDETTVDEIAAAVGVSRRTFFRYYESKPDVVWGEFDAELVRLRERLAEAGDDQPMLDVLRRAVMATNRFGAGELDELRIRIGLISSVPTLVAHSAVRYGEWCDVVAGFVARRLGGEPDGLVAQTIARSVLGAATAAFTWWATHGGDDLIEQLDHAFRLVATGFDEGRLRRAGTLELARRTERSGAKLGASRGARGRREEERTR